MKIHTIGLLALLAWSSLATYLYVCKIQGFCNESITMQYAEPFHEQATAIDTLSIAPVPNVPVIPEKQIIYFAFDKSEIKSTGINESYIHESNAYLEYNKDATLSIIGHTDAVGTTVYNNKLGYRRAESVQYYFETKGIPKRKIIIASKGENLPVGDNGTVAGREKNRRTEITIKK
ncbi:MAG: OmpA family protein [Salinivirgaceae bacterium]|jgi:outer membrane protein OmpA-like peptidoglycan-associated protein|nr:OmpA family protein [Salinivirgaceae bacterium]